MKVKALCTIHTGSKEPGKPAYHAPGSVFDLDDKDARDLIKRKAVVAVEVPKVETPPQK